MVNNHSIVFTSQMLLAKNLTVFTAIKWHELEHKYIENQQTI